MPQQSIPARAGIGLRAEHYETVVSEQPAVGWFEVHTENYFGQGGVPHHYLHKVRENHAISFHGVGLSLGSTDQLDLKHLARTKQLIDEYEPALVSEHLAWSSVNGVFTNDLLPLPLTREAFDHFSSRVEQVQDFLGQRILIENPSTYISFSGAEIAEPEFLNALALKTGCGLILDVNNVYVCAINHQFDPREYLHCIDPASVQEIHLAGHTRRQSDAGLILIDTHNARVCEEVWSLYRYSLACVGGKPTLIEWDSELPEFEVLLDEARMAQAQLDELNVVAA